MSVETTYDDDKKTITFDNTKATNAILDGVDQNYKHKVEYKTWMYISGEDGIKQEVVFASEARARFEDGWRMTPSEFCEDEMDDGTMLKDNEMFQAQCDDLAKRLNQFLNIDETKDKKVLLEMVNNFLQIPVPKRIGIKRLRKLIKETADKHGFLLKG